MAPTKAPPDQKVLGLRRVLHDARPVVHRVRGAVPHCWAVCSIARRLGISVACGGGGWGGGVGLEDRETWLGG